MTTDISLRANDVFQVRFATRALGLQQFGWAFVVGESGSATAQVIDNNNQAQNPEDVPVPGIFASVVRESQAPNQSRILVRAGADGFRGQLHFDIIQSKR